MKNNRVVLATAAGDLIVITNNNQNWFTSEQDYDRLSDIIYIDTCRITDDGIEDGQCIEIEIPIDSSMSTEVNDYIDEALVRLYGESIPAYTVITILS